MEVYYKLYDIDTVAKNDGNTTYVFNDETGKWDVDKNHVVADRLENADGGSLGVYEQISKDEAQLLIGYEEDGTESSQKL